MGIRGFGGIGGGGGGGAFGALSHGNRVAYQGAKGGSTPYGRLGIAADAMTAARPWDNSRGASGFNGGRYARGFGYAGLGDAAATSDTSTAELVGATAGAYQAQQDAYNQILKLQAKIDNLVATQAQMPSFLRGVIQGRIDVMRAELEGTKRKLAMQVEGEGATRDWRSIGQTAGVVGIFAGVALTGLLITLAVKSAKSAKRTNGRRRRNR
jgi:hypothetical protein